MAGSTGEAGRRVGARDCRSPTVFGSLAPTLTCSQPSSTPTQIRRAPPKPTPQVRLPQPRLPRRPRQQRRQLRLRRQHESFQLPHALLPPPPNALPIPSPIPPRPTRPTPLDPALRVRRRRHHHPDQVRRRRERHRLRSFSPPSPTASLLRPRALESQRKWARAVRGARGGERRRR